MERQNELAKLIAAAVASSLESNEPTVREVADVFIADNEDMIRDFGYDLAVRQIRTMVSASMKRLVEINRESGEQFQLPFDIEGVPSAITFPDDTGGEDRHIALSRATEWHLDQYAKLLRRQIAADSARLGAIEELQRALSDAFSSNPGITVKEACAMYRSDSEVA